MSMIKCDDCGHLFSNLRHASCPKCKERRQPAPGPSPSEEDAKESSDNNSEKITNESRDALTEGDKKLIEEYKKKGINITSKKQLVEQQNTEKGCKGCAIGCLSIVLFVAVMGMITSIGGLDCGRESDLLKRYIMEGRSANLIVHQSLRKSRACKYARKTR